MTETAATTASPATFAPALAAGLGLAAAVGVGRFVYTPLLRAMVDAHRMDTNYGALIAAANYAGYLAGAVLLVRRPELNNRKSFRLASAVLIASEALMTVSGPTLLPALLRLVAGLASAVIFVGCAGTVAKLGGRGNAAGIVFGGVGFGIAMTGFLVLVTRSALSWQGLWLSAAGLTVLLLIPALRLDIHPGQRRTDTATPQRSNRAWRALFIAYSLEGVGYIVIGTFLVAAVSAHNGTALGSAMWLIVGVAATPAVLWSMVARRWSAAHTLVIALAAQCGSAALLAVSAATWSAIVAAALFGGTFMGITMLAIRLGTELTDHRAAATLTAGYGSGQMLGPLVVAPVLGDGYSTAFALATVVLTAATAAAVIVARNNAASDCLQIG